MILDRIIRFLDGEKGRANQGDNAKEAPLDVPSLADTPPRLRSQPLQRTEPPMPERPETLSIEAERFLADMVTPYQAGFHSFGILGVTYELVRILDEYGSCPSVVRTLKRHDEDRSLDGKTLSLVPLAEHSYRVARMMVGLYRERRRGPDTEMIIPTMVVTGLAHDLGKIPEFRERHVERYAMADHPIIGATIIEEIFASCQAKMLYGLREAILNHHRGDEQENLLLEYLRKADARAREEEVKIHAERTWQSWEQWFIPEEFLGLLVPEVNVMRGRNCQIFTFKSVVYAAPDFLYNKAVAYARIKRVTDPVFTSSQDKSLALKRIAGTLRQHGTLSGEFPSDYYGMLYQITTKKFFFKLFLTPFKIEAFDVFPSIFEDRKIGWLKIIVNVSPCAPKK
ncbi:MAG: HD domain protein [Syntrophorhabdus sp. PtaU1.Bin153]|nr:MAG: HD domain protein [Syntrophorhabdus sp. PtaU1.Bin153]